MDKSEQPIGPVIMAVGKRREGNLFYYTQYSPVNKSINDINYVLFKDGDRDNDKYEFEGLFIPDEVDSEISHIMYTDGDEVHPGSSILDEIDFLFFKNDKLKL